MLDYSALPYDDIKPNVANKGEAVSDEPQRTDTKLIIGR